MPQAAHRAMRSLSLSLSCGALFNLPVNVPLSGNKDVTRTVRTQRTPITADCPSNVRAQSAPAGRTLRENRAKRFTLYVA